MALDQRTHRSSSMLVAPFAATRRLAARTVALALLLAAALLWVTVLALAASTSVAPATASAATDAAALVPTTSALSLRALMAWLHDKKHRDAPTPATTPIAMPPVLRGTGYSDADNRIAAPLSPALVGVALNATTTVAEYNESAALYLAHVTSVSYCQAPHIRDWSCQPCGLIAPLESVQVVHDPRNSFQGLAGYSREAHAIVVAFRGSMDLANWIDNMTFIKKRAYHAFPNVLVHQGFYWVYQSVATQLVPAVHALVAAHPTARVLVTGHSLGGAVAAICTFELAFLEAVNVSALYTFGAPRSGNTAFSTMMHNSSIDVFRITHFRDIVPHLPPTWIGFKHTTREVYYDEFQSTYTLCDAASGEDLTCSNACSPFGCTSVVDHLTYLNVTMSHLIC